MGDVVQLVHSAVVQMALGAHVVECVDNAATIFVGVVIPSDGLADVEESFLQGAGATGNIDDVVAHLGEGLDVVGATSVGIDSDTVLECVGLAAALGEFTVSVLDGLLANHNGDLDGFADVFTFLFY